MKKYMILFIILSIIFISTLTACIKNDIEKQEKSQKLQKPLANEPEINTEISSYTTNIIDKSTGRVHNLRLALQKLDGTIIEPGTYFSFNDTVGKADEASGFKKALVIKEEELEMDEGGGICQISSTLYNAAELAGMEISERHSHTKDVGYVPEGKDAAIAYGEWDLKFKNTSPFPIKIETTITEKQVMISLVKEWRE